MRPFRHVWFAPSSSIARPKCLGVSRWIYGLVGNSTKFAVRVGTELRLPRREAAGRHLVALRCSSSGQGCQCSLLSGVLMPVASLARRALNGTGGRNQNAESYNHTTSQQTTSLLKFLILWVLLVQGASWLLSFKSFGLIKSSRLRKYP